MKPKQNFPKNTSSFFAAVSVVIAVSFAAAAEPAAFLPDRLIIKFSSSLPGAQPHNAPATLALPGRCNDILRAAQARDILQMFPEKSSALQKGFPTPDLSSIYEIRFGRDLDIPKIASLLRAQPGVVYVEPLYLRQLVYTPNDPAIAQGLQNYLTTINAQEGWDISHGDSSIVIAIIDSGVDWQHEDLEAKIWSNPGEIPGNGNDDDGNGYVDDIRGWDFGGLNGAADNDPREDRGEHGTHVAGIAAAATDNATGVAGVAFNCKIMPVKVTQNDYRNQNDQLLLPYAYRGVLYAADNGASVINCSWGGSGYSQFEQEVIDYATSLGAVVVAAAGNENSSEEFFPAAYENVLAVAATNNSDVRTTFSNYGNWVTVSAPGQSIYNTYQSTNSPYASISGTSMSSPMAAGVCALVKSIHKDWSPQQIAQQVRISADNIDGSNPAYFKKLGHGRINVGRALTISSPAVRWTNMIVSEITGDQDGIVEPGETIGINFTLKNYFQAVNNLRVTASTTEANIAFTRSELVIGSLAANETRTTADQIIFQVAGIAAADNRLSFLLDIAADGYSDWQSFTIAIKPASADVYGGNVAMTISSFGALGYNNYAESGFGIGLGFQSPRGTSPALYHGGFIIATAANRVSDVSYGRADGVVLPNGRYDFATTAEGNIRRRSPGASSMELVSRFNDSAAESPLGVEIRQTALAWNDPPNDDFVVLQYVIQNKSAAALNNLYAGIYLDWDVGAASDNNFAGWDAATQVGYMYANPSSYYGVCAILPAAASSYRAINNPNEVWGNQFTDARKYQNFIGGFSVTSGALASDWSQQIGVGPFSLQPAATMTVAFALLGGTDLDDLKANAQAARAVYTVVGVDDDTSIPLRFELSQNAPNPFSSRHGQTTITYSLAKPALVDVRIFNLLGQEVAVLRNEPHQIAGRYSLSWNGRNALGATVPSGIYFYQVLAGDVRMVRRMVVVR